MHLRTPHQSHNLTTHINNKSIRRINKTLKEITKAESPKTPPRQMDRRFILLKSISCRGVKSFNLFQKPSTYAVVSIAPKNENRQKRKQPKQKTQIDHEGGENPDWDQTIELDLDDTDLQNLILEFAIMVQGNLLLFGDKLIGKSRVPMSDLSLGFAIPSDSVRHVSYQVRSPEGKPNGVLNFSYSLKLAEIETQISPPIGDYIPPPAPARGSLYPPLPLPETEQEGCFCDYNQAPPQYYPALDREISSPVLSRESYFSPRVVEKEGYYAPPPPPPPPAVFTPAMPLREAEQKDCFCDCNQAPPPYYPVLSREGYFSPRVVENGGYYAPPPPPPPAAAAFTPAMPAFGAYYPQSSAGYIYPPPQASCGYWNCK